MLWCLARSVCCRDVAGRRLRHRRHRRIRVRPVTGADLAREALVVGAVARAVGVAHRAEGAAARAAVGVPRVEAVAARAADEARAKVDEARGKADRAKAAHAVAVSRPAHSSHAAGHV